MLCIIHYNIKCVCVCVMKKCSWCTDKRNFLLSITEFKIDFVILI